MCLKYTLYFNYISIKLGESGPSQSDSYVPLMDLFGIDKIQFVVNLDLKREDNLDHRTFFFFNIFY